MEPLRKARINARINQIQTQLRNNGYRLDGTDLPPIGGWEKEACEELWYLGFALHNPALPEQPQGN